MLKLQNKHHARNLGLTTVELLVVLGIIGVILSVSVPVLLRTGLIGGQRAELGGRELYTMLRATRLYATTYNMDAAIVYGIRRAQDPSPPPPPQVDDTIADSVSGLIFPFVDSYAIVRRVRQVDLEIPEFFPLAAALDNDPNISINSPIYVPVGGPEGSFKRFANETAVLQDIFEVRIANNFGTPEVYSATGLSDILIWDVDGDFFYTPAVEYNLVTRDNSFPAHVFLPSGALSPNDNLRQQRITLRVGMRPDADPIDRFITDPVDAVFNGIASEDTIQIAVDQNNIISFPVYRNGTPLDPAADELDIDMDIEVYVAHGRVKVKS